MVMVRRPLKVYGWTALLTEADRKRLGDKDWITQCRAIVAARSKAEVGRIVNRTPAHLFCLCETGNAVEREVALADPGQVFITSNHQSARKAEHYIKPEGRTW